MEKKPFNFKPKFQKRQEHKTNEMITHQNVRITGDGIESKICSSSEALAIAQSMELDLVEINEKAIPPVCKIINYGKFLYEKKKRDKENNQGNKSILKEIKLGPNTQENDLNYKSKHAVEFLKEGNKVKVSMLFRAREITFKERGEIVMLKFLQMIEDFGKPEFMPKFEGKNLFVTVTPKNTSKKAQD